MILQAFLHPPQVSHASRPYCTTIWARTGKACTWGLGLLGRVVRDAQVESLHISLAIFTHYQKRTPGADLLPSFERPRCCTSVVCCQCLKASKVRCHMQRFAVWELRVWPKTDIEDNTCCSIALWRPQAKKLDAMTPLSPLCLSRVPKQRASQQTFRHFCMLSCFPIQHLLACGAHQSMYHNRPMDAHGRCWPSVADMEHRQTQKRQTVSAQAPWVQWRALSNVQTSRRSQTNAKTIRLNITYLASSISLENHTANGEYL